MTESVEQALRDLVWRYEIRVVGMGEFVRISVIKWRGAFAEVMNFDGHDPADMIVEAHRVLILGGTGEEAREWVRRPQ